MHQTAIALPSTARPASRLIFTSAKSRRARYGRPSRNGPTREGADSFLSEIGWREFSHNLLYHFPKFPDENFQNKFDGFPWAENEEAFGAWKAGCTGYPIVDAGMRQLWETGWMHNRVRMITASFLIKDLMVHWKRGEAWFWHTLVDADLANNSAGWQWVAGCGADAAPYFRIFNPVSQGEKFDPKGEYVRRWVPELRSTLFPYTTLFRSREIRPQRRVCPPLGAGAARFAQFGHPRAMDRRQVHPASGVDHAWRDLSPSACGPQEGARTRA